VSPDILAPLRAPIASLPGVGPRFSSLLAKLVGGDSVRDLLFHLPIDFLDRRHVTTIAAAQPGAIATLRIDIIRHELPEKKSHPTRVIIGDATGFAEIVLFHPARLPQFPKGAKLLISGKLDLFADRKTMPHPDFVLPVTQEQNFPFIEPVWPLTAGIVPRVFRRAALAALTLLPDLPEWHDSSILKSRKWPGFAESFHLLHAPTETIPDEKPFERLAYDELLARQIAFAVSRSIRRKRPGISLTGDGRLRKSALQKFGFSLTASQLQALREIDTDLAAPQKMLRLLQGDVGSGKTILALLAMLRAVEAGAQAALLAPTEILAKQHFSTIQKYASVPVAFLSGNIKGKARGDILEGLADGAIPLLVGTHAIFQKHVEFQNLALAVIDEQHRFGVDQRLAFAAKGAKTDLLVMTATPIPRSLLLTHWGEMDISRLTEKPAGRKPITTTMHKLADLEKVFAAIARAIARGGRIYWVCPLVSESEFLDATAAIHRHATLREKFGNIVTLAHGQMDPSARDGALKSFQAGIAKILVATTVIEVGVDVPEANVIVIEHAERFGLAQLHQLRGRVGRGAAASFCLLLHDDKLSTTTKKRLSFLKQTEDGFAIADEDFRTRGPGDYLGTKQSGLPGYRLADPEKHEDLLPMARQDAILILQRDPKLESPRGHALKILLNLFDQREALTTVKSG
jgi:ATP-dependent DNA helicase RecG